MSFMILCLNGIPRTYLQLDVVYPREMYLRANRKASPDEVNFGKLFYTLLLEIESIQSPDVSIWVSIHIFSQDRLHVPQSLIIQECPVKEIASWREVI